MVEIGSVVRIGRQEKPEDDFKYSGYLARVSQIEDERAFVETDSVDLRQSVSFKAWLPLSTLSEIGHADAGDIKKFDRVRK